MKKKAITLSLILLTVGGFGFMVQWANYNAATEHAAADDAGILYTYLIMQKKNWCFLPSEEAMQIQSECPGRYGLTDRWGKIMKINCDDAGVNNVCSFGRDGTENTDDDICVNENGIRKGDRTVKWKVRDWRAIIKIRSHTVGKTGL